MIADQEKPILTTEARRHGENPEMNVESLAGLDPDFIRELDPNPDKSTIKLVWPSCSSPRLRASVVGFSLL